MMDDNFNLQDEPFESNIAGTNSYLKYATTPDKSYNWYRYKFEPYDDSYSGIFALKIDSGNSQNAYQVFSLLKTLNFDANNITNLQQFRNYALMIESGVGEHNHYYYGSTYGLFANGDIPYYPVETPTEVRNGQVFIGQGSLYYPDSIPIEQATNYFKHDLICNFPIFEINDFTQDELDNINNYIHNGDDSGAWNYDDLHPLTVVYNVFLDGDNLPNLYVSCDITQGECGGSILSTTNLISPKKMKDDSMNLYTFSELSNGNNDTTITFLPEKYYEGTPIMPNDWAVQFKLYNDGRFEYLQRVSSNFNISLNVERKVPDSDDYPDDYEPNDDTSSRNSYDGTNTLTKTYLVDSLRLRQLGNFLWSSSFKENIFGLINSPIENIVSLKAMPLGVGGEQEQIKIGNVETGINGNVVSNSGNIEVTVGTTFIEEKFHNFIDYMKTKITIYLPYIGFKELPTSMVMNRNLRVFYHYDCILGNVLAELHTTDNDGQFQCFMTAQGNCGIDIPITSTNRASIENGYITNGLSAITSLVSGNVGGAISSAIGAVNQEFHSQSNGVGNPSLMCSLSNVCYLIISRPNKYLPSNYGHTVGYPCNLVKQLKTLDGFTVVENFQTNDIVNCTYTEKQMIKDLMESGVYIHLD